MNKKSDQYQNSLENLLNSFAENIYTDNEEELNISIQEEGIDADFIENRVLKAIKKMQLQVEANKTHCEMGSIDILKQKAVELVNSLLNKVDFSLPTLIKEEKLSMSFRNIESLNKEDIKNTLVNHFTLKFLEEEKKKPNGI